MLICVVSAKLGITITIHNCPFDLTVKIAAFLAVSEWQVFWTPPTVEVNPVNGSIIDVERINISVATNKEPGDFFPVPSTTQVVYTFNIDDIVHQCAFNVYVIKGKIQFGIIYFCKIWHFPFIAQNQKA